MGKRFQIFCHTYGVQSLVGLYLIGTALLFTVCGARSQIAVPDNLDLFVAQLRMLSNTGTFFAQGAEAPFLGGVSRDCLPSEFSLYTVLYMLLPTFAAYVTGYLLQVVIGTTGFVWLLRKGILPPERYEALRPVVWLCGFAYGQLHLFPAFGICFASLPWILLFLIRLYRLGAGESPRRLTREVVLLYGAVFCYPFVSYFSYFGFFLLAYLVLAILILWIRDRRLSGTLCLALVLLALGYVCFEYRLFHMMLADPTVTIRSTMVDADLPPLEALRMGAGILFGTPVMHVEDVHQYLVMPVCCGYLLFLNGRYLYRRDLRGLRSDPINLLALLLVFGSLIYALYFCGPFRRLIWWLVPPLTGFQFNRVYFLHPLLWLLQFCLVCDRLHVRRGLSVLLAAGAALLVLCMPTTYNDLYHTARAEAVRLLRGHEPETLSYGEFYGEALFASAREAIDYNGEWSVAYGFHPAVLEYNGIRTLDGYLGFYPQAYKESFREVIAPALDRMPQTARYYDEWGARCYLYSGTDESIVAAVRHPVITDTDIYIDETALAALGCRYLFSRIELSNADDHHLRLREVCTSADTPCTLYVYELMI